jgi:hypothetical protein
MGYSYDGFNWNTSISTSFTSQYLTWDGGKWLVTGYQSGQNGVIAISYDGVTWNNLFPSGAAYNINYAIPAEPTRSVNYVYKICYAGNKWFASWYTNTSYIYILVSQDGITWTLTSKLTLTGSFGQPNCMASNGTILLIGSGGGYGAGGNPNFLYTYTCAFGYTSIYPFFDWGIVYDIQWNGTLFVAVGGSSSTPIGYSYDGVNWLSGIGVNSSLSTSYYSVLYSKQLQQWIAFGATGIQSMSSDGVNWTTIQTNIAVANSYSKVGVNETDFQKLYPYMNALLTMTSIGVGFNTGIANITFPYTVNIGGTPFYPTNANCIQITTSNLNYGNTPSVAGLFVYPIRNDTTLGQTTTMHYNTSSKELTWGNEASDQRLKSTIQYANLDLCYSTIQAIPLRYFEWNQEYISSFQFQDTHTLGYIAQEVQPYFPKSIYIYSNSFLPDLHTLDMDQLYKAHIGATKCMISGTQARQSTLDSLVQRLTEKGLL